MWYESKSVLITSFKNTNKINSNLNDVHHQLHLSNPYMFLLKETKFSTKTSLKYLLFFPKTRSDPSSLDSSWIFLKNSFGSALPFRFRFNGKYILLCTVLTISIPSIEFDLSISMFVWNVQTKKCSLSRSTFKKTKKSHDYWTSN